MSQNVPTLNDLRRLAESYPKIRVYDFDDMTQKPELPRRRMTILRNGYQTLQLRFEKPNGQWFCRVIEERPIFSPTTENVSLYEGSSESIRDLIQDCFDKLGSVA